MFKSIPVAKKTDRLDTLSEAVRGFEREVVTLGWEERLRARARRRSDRGFEFATALPRGTILYEDDCLVFEAQRIIVRVVEREEAMLVVRPNDHREWGVFAYHIGNSHQPVMIVDDAIICPDALGMDQLLKVPRDSFRARASPIHPTRPALGPSASAHAMTDQLVVLLHLCDSLFPIGSFAHSDGLEAATARGAIRTAGDLRGWMEVTLAEGLRRVEGPAVARAWDAVSRHQFDLVSEIDDEVYAFRPTSTGREATRAMGSRLLKTWQQIRPHQTVGVVLSQRPRMTLPVAFGVVSSASGIPVRAALEGFMYTRLAAIVSGAMRLMPLGQGGGHALLSDMLTGIPTVADQVLEDDGPLTSFTPVMDVMMMSQQYVESRLFKS